MASCLAQENYRSSPSAGAGTAGKLMIDPGVAGAAGADDGVGGTGGSSMPDELSCTSSAQCAPPLPYCEPPLGRCVECTTNRNCTGTTRPFCDMKSFVCVTCLTEQQCGHLAPYCETTVGECVECLTSANCGVGGLGCDRFSHRCVPSCSNDEQCQSTPQTPFCDVERTLCVACKSDQDCPTATPRCDPDAKACVSCINDADCGVGAPRCDPRQHACVACLTKADCRLGAQCVANVCVDPK